MTINDVLNAASSVIEETTEAVEPAPDPQEATQTPASDPAPEAEAQVADALMDKLFARIAPPTEVKYRKVFLYGPPGCGKTVLSATAPKPLIVRIEPTGTVSLYNHPDLLKNVQTFEFLSVVQLEILIDKILADPAAFQKRCVESFGYEIETFVVDSMSELQRIDLDTIIAREYKSDPSRNQYTRTWPDYNENTIHMAQLAGKLCKLPMNVIATCHAKDKEDKGKGLTMTMPSLTDVLAEKCAGFFDVFAYMTVNDDGTKRTLQLSPTKTVTAKTRIGGLPPVVEDPTWDKLFGHLPK